MSQENSSSKEELIAQTLVQGAQENQTEEADGDREAAVAATSREVTINGTADSEEEEEEENYGEQSVDCLEDLDPPRTRSEQFRDSLLVLLDGRAVQILSILAIFLVIADGALFFFLLMGWHRLCRPRTDCEPRNWWYNWSIQVLCGLFTYMVTVSMPWRTANFMHTMGWHCPRRENKPGHDLYGLPTKDIWFHIPLAKRIMILIMFILNVLTQYANQVSRGIYYSYELQNEYPGSLWTSIFFGLSFLFAFLATVFMLLEGRRLRKGDPDFFGPGPAEMAKEMWKKHCRRRRRRGEEEEEEEEEESEVEEEEEEIPEDELRYQHEDPTRNPQPVIGVPNQQAELRMWAI